MLIPMKIDYSIRLVTYLANQPTGKLTKSLEISKAKHIPLQYLLQISNSLIKGSMISGQRGPNGGYALLKKPENITVADIVKSLDHSVAPVACIEFPDGCKFSGNCSQQEMWLTIEKMILNELSKVKISSLIDDQVYVPMSDLV